MDKYNYPLTSVNFGGGFGIPYINNDMPLDKKLTTEKMIELIESLGKEINFIPKDVFIEPGRSIVGNSCVTLYTCGDFKHTFGDKNYQFIDGGMTDNIRPALYDAEYACDVVNKMTNEKNVVCDIAGKCCESGDIIIYNALLPKTENGDILMVYATGAYNYSMASNYNNMLKPAVVFIDNQPKLVARRETLDDLLKLFK
jgi:diaminopimelate decarboxylase